MSNRLAEDIERLQFAADAAGLIIYPDKNGRIGVSIETLADLESEMEARSLLPRDYRLIDDEARLLMQVARLLKLHRADNDCTKAERFQKLGEHLRAMVEVDLANARKSLEVMG